jgi:hypothetical protein
MKCKEENVDKQFNNINISYTGLGLLVKNASECMALLNVDPILCR